jgi:GTP diphosphokinase / guanosine-3',5'-bis(diphosphate) 3'-diphosphatase
MTANTADLEKEQREVERNYQRIIQLARPLLKDGDAQIIRKAFNMAQEAHEGVRRKSGELYIFHPLAVTEICVTEIGLGTTSIVAALLHDVVEDTEVTLEDIEKEFGSKISRIIDGLTKIAGVFDYGTSQQAENFRKMLLTLSEDVRVILIKLADRLHNMRTLEGMPEAKQLKVASETIYIFAPLAHRLGLYSIKSELEDLYLKYTQPKVYREIASKINATKIARERFIDDFLAPVKKELIKTGYCFEIKGRPKSIYSVWRKMNKQDIPFEEVYDLFAIRIILETPPEKEKATCWQVYSIITDYYSPNPERLRDWISTPKANGYESLHTTVMSANGQWVEVQIRSKRMDEIAEKGYAAHWKYKGHLISQRAYGLEDWIKAVRTMLEESDGNALEFVDDFRSNLYKEEVFIFTPKGDLKVLPNGATTLDFAFDIHTEVGASCTGAKVNNRLVPLNYLLKNGDQVEIITSGKQKPNEDWLRFVVSSKAKSKIKDILKEDKKVAAAEGKEIVRRKLRQMRMELDSLTLTELVEFFKLKTPLELYYKVGEGTIPSTSIKKFKLFKDEQLKQNQAETISDAKSFAKTVSEIKGEHQDQLLIGEDMDIVDYKMAECCNPIKGDDVFGFVTVNEGIKIHRTQCPNAARLMANYGYRVVKARWASEKENYFITGLKVIGTDRIGLISDITAVISAELKVNMHSFNMKSNDGIYEGTIMLYVHDRSHLDKLIAKLEEVNGVVRITRIDQEQKVS